MVPGPAGIGERAVGLEGDGVAVDVDLSGAFPLTAHGGVMQACVVRGHLGAGVVQDAAHDLLRDVVVDQARAQGVTELVRGHLREFAGVVADVAAPDPARELGPCRAHAQRAGTGGVVACAGEQHRGG